MKVCVVLSDGFEELEAIGSIALLKRSGIEVDIYTLQQNVAKGKHELYLSHLLPIDTLDMNKYDCLLLPGGPHYQELEKHPLVQTIIHYFMKTQKYIAAICAAPTILGRMGYLNNRQYTCFTSMDEDFKGQYVDKYVVCDGHLITAKSAAATIDFAFAIIQALQGSKQMQLIKQQIYY